MLYNQTHILYKAQLLIIFTIPLLILQEMKS